MAKRKRKVKPSKIRKLILVPISFLIIGYFLYLLISFPYTIFKLKKEEIKYEEELLVLELEEKNIKNEIEKLKDPDYLARYAREHYQYSKDGEIILKIDNVVEEKEKNVTDFNINKVYIFSGSILTLILIYFFIKGNH